jgi:hypothetical protein
VIQNPDKKMLIVEESYDKNGIVEESSTPEQKLPTKSLHESEVK